MLKILTQQTFTKIALVFLTLSLFISCSIEKRKHFSGYHIEILKEKDNRVAKAIKKNTDIFYRNEKADIEVCILSDSIQSTVVHKENQKKELGESIADNKESSISQNIKLNNHFLKPINNIEINKNYSIKKNKNTAAVDSSKSDSPSSFIKALGFGFLIGGLIVLWFISIILGILFMLLGLLFIIIAAVSKSTNSDEVDKKKSEKEDNRNNNFIDVVYLKNGSIIRGIIIEQIPNTQLKIQTKDGSVFVYKMEEVEKFTKEKE